MCIGGGRGVEEVGGVRGRSSERAGKVVSKWMYVIIMNHGCSNNIMHGYSFISNSWRTPNCVYCATNCLFEVLAILLLHCLLHNTLPCGQ